MNIPSRFPVGGRNFKYDAQNNRGVVYVQEDGIRFPYVMLKGIRHGDNFDSWLHTGVYRVRLSQAHGVFEFQRGALNPNVIPDEWVRSKHADAESIAFGKAFWTELSGSMYR